MALISAPHPPDAAFSSSESSSSSWSTLPLDCLALCAQHYDDVYTHTRIHSVNRHWRQILIHSTRYSFAYSSSGFILPLRWSDEYENVSYSHAKYAVRIENDRPLGFAILTGLQLSFRYLRQLSLNLDFSRFTTRLVNRITEFHTSMYTFFSSLAVLESFSLCESFYYGRSGYDLIRIIDRTTILPSHELLAHAILHMAHLREFHYDIMIDGADAVKRQEGITAAQHLMTIPDELILALTKSKGLKAIGGASFVQKLSEEQWTLLFSLCEQIESVSSLNSATIYQLRHLCRNKEENLPSSYTLAANRIRSLRLMQCVTHSRISELLHPSLSDGTTTVPSLSSISSTLRQIESHLTPIHFHQHAADMRANQLRSLIYHNDHIAHDVHGRVLAPNLPIDTLWIGVFDHLISLAIDLRGRQDFTPFGILARAEKPLVHLHELTIYNLYPDEFPYEAFEALGLFLSTLTSLRSFTLTTLTLEHGDHTTRLTSQQFFELLSQCNCKKLLELRLTHCIIEGFTPEAIIELVKMLPSISLLTLENIKCRLPSTYQWDAWMQSHSDQVNLVALELLAPKCVKMMEYARCITWLDLMTLDRDVIQRKIAQHTRKAAAAAKVTSSSLLSSTDASSCESSSHPPVSSPSSPASLNNAFIHWSGCEWWQDWQRLQQMNQLEAKLKLTPETTSKKKKKQQIFKSPPAPRLVGIELNPGPSASWSIILLDCLALICQYTDSVRTLSRIQSVSHHWRTILISADRYSHAYQTCGSVIILRWTNDEENLTDSHARSSWVKLRDPPGPLGLRILEGLTICFRHLRTFSFNFECLNSTKLGLRKIVILRKSLYTLLRSLRLLEHLSLCDHTSRTEDEDTPSCMSHTRLADSILHMTHLRTFYYDVKISDRTKNSPIPDSLVDALVRSKQLRAIGGTSFVEMMSVQQWIKLLSSLDHIECLTSMNKAAMLRLKQICCGSDQNSVHTESAIHRIRSLRMIDQVYHTQSLDGEYSWLTSPEFYPIAAEIGSHQLRSLHLTWTETIPLGIIVSFPQLTSLTIDLSGRHDLSQLVQLTTTSTSSSTSITSTSSLSQLHELIFYNDLLDIPSIKSFLSSISSLRCLTLYKFQSLAASNLLALLTSCSHQLLQFRLRRSLIHKLTTDVMIDILNVQSSLQLLTLDKVTFTMPPNTSQSGIPFDLDQLVLKLPKAAKMMQAAKALTWLDLMTLDKVEIRRRRKAAVASTPTTAAAVAAVMTALPSMPVLTALRRYSGSDWRERWLQLQQIDRLQAKATTTNSSLIPPEPRLVGIELNPGPSSASWSTILLDCLTLITQYSGDLTTITRIHSVSRHWRRILIEADRYSHAYLTTSTEWPSTTSQGIENGGTTLDGLALSFRHLHSFTLLFLAPTPEPNQTKPSSRRIIQRRKDVIALLCTFQSLEHLSIGISIESELEVEIFVKSIQHLTTLKSFHLDFATSLTLGTTPQPIVRMLYQSKKLEAIGGASLVQHLSEEQWLMIFSSLSRIECVASLNHATMTRLKNICLTPLEQQSELQTLAISRIRSLRLLESDGHPEAITYHVWSHEPKHPRTIPITFYSDLAEMKCTQLRSYHHHVVVQFNSALGLLNYLPLLTQSPSLSTISSFKNLLALMIDLKFCTDYSPFSDFTRTAASHPLSNLHELTFYNLTNPVPFPVGLKLSEFAEVRTDRLCEFLSGLTSLRCFILLKSDDMDVTMLSRLLTSCSRCLLELRIGNCEILNLTPEIIVEHMKSLPQLCLLALINIHIGRAKTFSWNNLMRLHPKSAKMIRAVNAKLTWLDMMTIDRQEIQRRIRYAPKPKQAPVSSIPKPQLQTQRAEESRRFAGVHWRGEWAKLRQLDRLEQKLEIEQKQRNQVAALSHHPYLASLESS